METQKHNLNSPLSRSLIKWGVTGSIGLIAMQFPFPLKELAFSSSLRLPNWQPGPLKRASDKIVFIFSHLSLILASFFGHEMLNTYKGCKIKKKSSPEKKKGTYVHTYIQSKYCFILMGHKLKRLTRFVCAVNGTFIFPQNNPAQWQHE